MDSTPVHNERGIALFMVIAAMTVLSILVSEFTYVVQVSQKVAVDGLDQVKAHYLAKSALKISLLRLKAYQSVKGIANDSKNPIGSAIPKQLLDQIWRFPFIYPLPTTLPGMSPSDKERVQKFLDESALDGQFSASIESESSRYNLNMLLASFVPKPTSTPTPTPTTTATPDPVFDPEAARKSLSDYLLSIFQNKLESDEEFAYVYRDYKMEDLVDQMSAWVDSSYKPNYIEKDHPIPMKKGPYYSITELHMLPLMDDRIYDLITPSLTASKTAGINVNTITEATLRAIVPQMTEGEAKDFFKFRDDPETDNQFKNADRFFAWIINGVASFRGDQAELDRYKASLQKRNIYIVTEETEFKITIEAQSNKARKLIEAWVTLTGKGSTTNQPANQPSDPAQPGLFGPGRSAVEADPGLRITFMRIQ